MFNSNDAMEKIRHAQEGYQNASAKASPGLLGRWSQTAAEKRSAFDEREIALGRLSQAMKEVFLEGSAHVEARIDALVKEAGDQSAQLLEKRQAMRKMRASFEQVGALGDEIRAALVEVRGDQNRLSTTVFLSKKERDEAVLSHQTAQARIFEKVQHLVGKAGLSNPLVGNPSVASIGDAESPQLLSDLSKWQSTLENLRQWSDESAGELTQRWVRANESTQKETAPFFSRAIQELPVDLRPFVVNSPGVVFPSLQARRRGQQVSPPETVVATRAQGPR